MQVPKTHSIFTSGISCHLSHYLLCIWRHSSLAGFTGPAENKEHSQAKNTDSAASCRHAWWRELICIYTRVFLYMHICTDLHMHIYLYVSLYKYAPSMHMFIHIQHVYYIPLYTDMYLYMHILIHILHGYKYTATYMQMPICVYMSVYMYSLSL